ncbi:MAG: hypothetical protein AAF739_09445 [Pseudomonadota bacterium]
MRIASQGAQLKHDMNLNTYHPLASFDLLAIGIALVVVMGFIGFRVLTGRPWRRTLPPDEIDAPGFPTSRFSDRDSRPRGATPLLGKDSIDDPR